MKLLVFTTETIHHAYFVSELARWYPIERVYVETRTLSAPFDVHHPFEEKREVIESERWFNGKKMQIGDFAEVRECRSVNDDEIVQDVAAVSPDVILVFGTGLLREPIINVCAGGMINLHGGDVERYRGLDTHLWAIYHGDFSALVTTLHRVNAELDDGEILLEAPLSLTSITSLSELRAVSTEACVDLAVSALAAFEKLGHFVSYPQSHIGRYYSFMPACLKEVCVARVRKHLESI